MSREAALVGVLVFAFVLIGGISAQYQTAVEEGNNETRVINETINVDNGTLHVLNESRRDVVYNESVAVFQNGTQWSADGNYTWFSGNGTLFIPEDTGLNASKSAGVTYGFWVPTGAQKVSRDVVLLPYDLGESLGLIVGAALVLTALVVLARQR